MTVSPNTEGERKLLTKGDPLTVYCSTCGARCLSRGAVLNLLTTCLSM